MSEKKKIIVFTPDLHSGGVANVVAHTLQMYAAHPSYETALMVYENTDIRFDIPPGMEVCQLHVPYYVGTANGSFNKALRWIGRIVLFPLALLKSFFILRRLKPDIAVGHGILCNIILVLLKRKYRIVVVEHGVPSRPVPNSGFISGLMQRTNRKLYSHIDRFVAISDLIRSSFMEKFSIPADRIHKIVNPVDIAKVNKVKEEALPAEMARVMASEPVLLAACRMIEQKSIHTIVEATAILASRGITNFKVILVGDGPLKPGIQALIEEKGLKHRIFMPGFDQNPYKYIHRCYAYLSASIYEGYPVALIEAISLGKPVVATDCASGPREIAGTRYRMENRIEIGECGVLTPVHMVDGKPVSDPVAFADGMQFVLERADLYEEFCKNALSHSKKNDIFQIAELWYKMFANL